MTEGTVDRRTLIGGFVTAVATSGLAGAACAQSAPKTFVLVHGAFLGGWCWRRVSDRLAESGHKVFSPTLSGLGERSHLLSNSVNFDMHVADIVNVIKWEGLNDICLVVHSYGGAPGSGALDQIGDRVSSIVWLDAFKPKNGERMMDLSPVFGTLRVVGSIPSALTSKMKYLNEFPEEPSLPNSSAGKQMGSEHVSQAAREPCWTDSDCG